MKKQRGRLKEEKGDNDMSAPSATSPSTRSIRRSRMVCQSTFGSVEKGKLADPPLWFAGLLGVKPDCIIKGGTIVAAPNGRPQRSIPTPQPVHYRPMSAPFRQGGHRVIARLRSRRPRQRAKLREQLGVEKSSSRSSTRGDSSKKSMDPQRRHPRTSRSMLKPTSARRRRSPTCAPAEVLPMASGIFLF